MSALSAEFDAELTWVVECLQEAEEGLRRLHHRAGFEEVPVAIGKRLKNKARGVAVQRDGLEEIARGELG